MLFQKDDDTTSKISSSRVDYEGNPIEHQSKNEKIEIGYFHMLNCDIKASEDMIRSKYLIKTEELIKNHMIAKEKTSNQKAQIFKNMINLNDEHDLEFLKNMHEVVTAYQIISD